MTTLETIYQKMFLFFLLMNLDTIPFMYLCSSYFKINECSFHEYLFKMQVSQSLFHFWWGPLFWQWLDQFLAFRKKLNLSHGMKNLSSAKQSFVKMVHLRNLVRSPFLSLSQYVELYLKMRSAI
jgi:hypothetical protein